MAVVSISRIQVRRGRKNNGTGLPQLASGEFGWAIDSQELFIGNGSVAEGAPYVGNTKLLSEHDNLFDFASNYVYKNNIGFIQTGSAESLPVTRSLQERLDDRISIRSFGAEGDGTDQTSALQRAVDQLFLNPANKGQSQSRVELIIEPGEYIISSTIFIPPFVTIRGSGIGKTIIITGNHTAFKTVNETSTVGSYASDAVSTTLNQARNIQISGLTIQTPGNPVFEIQSCKDSMFKDIEIQGPWEIGDPVDRSNVAILLGGLSTAVTSQNNFFENIKIQGFAYGIISDQDINNNIFNNFNFNTLWAGIVFGENTTLGTSGQLTGPKNNTVSGSVFDDIMSNAIVVYAGPENVSQNNKFFNVGNNGGSPDSNAFAVIRFDDQGAVSNNDYFQRAEFLGYDQNFLVNVPYKSEIEGSQITEMNRSHTLPIGEASQAQKLFKLPAESKGKAYDIDYLYRSQQVNAVRSGKLTIAVDPVNNFFNLTDEYDFAGDGIYQENIDFLLQTYDENGDGAIDTIAVMMLNFTSSDEAELVYKVKYKT